MKIIKYLAVIILLTNLIISSPAQVALDWSTLASVADRSQFGGSHPRIAINGSGEAVIVWGRSASHSNYVSSGSNGIFKTPELIHPASLDTYVNNWSGAKIAANGNTVFVVFKAQPLETGKIFVVKSIDGGKSFGDTMSVGPSDNHIYFLPDIDVGSDGNPVIVYMKHDPNWVDPRYAVTNSMNGGVSFLPDVAATDFSPGEVCDCCPSSILQNNGKQVLVYRNNNQNLRNVWFTNSNDTGKSFQSGMNIDLSNWTINACPSSGPDGYIFGDSLIAVWMSGASNISRVHYATAKISTAQLGFSKEILSNLPNGVSQNYPRIAGNGDTIGIIWPQTYLGNTNVLFTYSVNGSKDLFVKIDTVNEAILGYDIVPDIAYRNGVFHLVFQNGHLGDLQYRSARVSHATGVEVNNPNTSFELYPNPANDQIHINGQFNSPLKYHIVNSLGQIMLKGSSNRSISISSLPKGNYMLIINENGYKPKHFFKY